MSEINNPLPGPNSIRLWESLAVGAIPIILADTLELPKHKLWDKAIEISNNENLVFLDDDTPFRYKNSIFHIEIM